MLSDGLKAKVEEMLGDRLVSVEPVAGGCIGRAARIQTSSRSFFAKWGPPQVSRTFVAEQAGLEALRAASSIVRIPVVVGSRTLSDGTGILVMEWIESVPLTGSLWAQLGRGLAEIHRKSENLFGFTEDNYIGSSVQKNTQCENWCSFFRDQRLRFQANLARSNNLWSSSWDAAFDRLCKELDDIVPEYPDSSLVHGDLWSGNILADTSGNPVLVDPAVYYGHREVDLAMSSLFGSLPNVFYDTYHTEWPVDEEYDRRKEVYNLYHLINHLNLFGTSYASSVASVLAKYR